MVCCCGTDKWNSIPNLLRLLIPSSMVVRRQPFRRIILLRRLKQTRGREFNHRSLPDQTRKQLNRRKTHEFIQSLKVFGCWLRLMMTMVVAVYNYNCIWGIALNAVVIVVVVIRLAVGYGGRAFISSVKYPIFNYNRHCVFNIRIERIICWPCTGWLPSTIHWIFPLRTLSSIVGRITICSPRTNSLNFPQNHSPYFRTCYTHFLFMKTLNMNPLIWTFTKRGLRLYLGNFYYLQHGHSDEGLFLRTMETFWLQTWVRLFGSLKQCWTNNEPHWRRTWSSVYLPNIYF